MNILDLLRRHGIEAKKASSTKGGEYASACPGCGGKDRFRVWPEQHNGEGAYWCRQCGKGGDAIQFLRDFDGLTFRQACERLGRRIPDSKDLSMRQPKQKTPDWTPREPADPDAIWKEKAMKLCVWAFDQLEKKPEITQQLKDRGISEATAIKFRLGWLPEDIYRNRESWGLSAVQDEETGKERQLWFPQGLVIPWLKDDEVVKLRIRRPDPIELGPRYWMVPGSMSATTLIRPAEARHKAVKREVYVIVESELDAIMIHEQAGDICGAVALGSNSAHPDVESAEILRSAVLILNALDFDAAGSSERQWWEKHYQQSKRWPTPEAKDPGDAYKAGVNIKEWIRAGLPEGMTINA
jgi:DNA primase